MDLKETMKIMLVESATISASVNSSSEHPAEGYVTENLYMLLQHYLKNKGWNTSLELLQCYSDLKESSLLPSQSDLQVMASRVGLDSQERLILLENGKIILPFEHFAKAVILKHMSGPHGLHLGVEATVRAVIESYTTGKENFGMEKKFILDVIQTCPNPACHFYKNILELTQKSMQHLSLQTKNPPDADA